MGLENLLKNFQSKTPRRLKRQLEGLSRTSYEYRNLDKGNREELANLLLKYKKRLRLGKNISDREINREMYNLYRSRHKKNLSKRDLEQFRKALKKLQGK